MIKCSTEKYVFAVKTNFYPQSHLSGHLPPPCDVFLLEVFGVCWNV
jgi:hypothetical protein